MTIAEPVVGSPPRRNGAAFREADSAPDGHMSAETLGTLLGQVSKPSLDESMGSRENYRPIAIAFDGEIEEHGAIAQQVLQLTKIIFESVKNLPTASARAGFELSAGCPFGFDRES